MSLLCSKTSNTQIYLGSTLLQKATAKDFLVNKLNLSLMNNAEMVKPLVFLITPSVIFFALLYK